MAGIFSNKKLEAARAAAEAEAAGIGAPVATVPPFEGAGAAATATAAAAPPAPSDSIRQALGGKYVCPFCGSVNENEQGTCPRCTMENTAASRKATKVRIGPWYVLQTRNPAAPGMKFETLLSFVKKGRVKPTSIVRGPTTHQLWRFAAQVKGLSREFGVCYSCGTSIDRTASICPQCNRAQDPPPNPDVLLEVGKEGPTPGAAAGPAGAAAAAAVAASANGVARAAANGARPPEPSLEAGEEEFVIPAIGSSPAGAVGANLSDSMAGFSMSDPLGGAVIDQPWARIDPNRAPNGQAGNGRGPAGRPGVGPRQPAPPAAGTPAYNPATGYTATPGQTGPYGYAEPAYGQPPAAAPRRPAPAAPGGGGFGGNGRPQPQRAEGFLSARDLAAAFKLQLADDGEHNGAPGRGTAQPVAPQSPYASPPAADLGPADPDALFNPPSFRRPRGRKGKIAIVLLLMALAAVGIALAVSEDFRQTSLQWFSRAKAGLDADPSKADLPGRNAGPADSGTTADGSKAFPRAGGARPASGRLPGATQPAAPTTRPTSPNRTGNPQANGVFDADPDSPADPGSASLSAHPMTASPEVTTTAASSTHAPDGWDAIAATPPPPPAATRPAEPRKGR